MSLSFMIVGHTRCLVDGHFGLLKRRYRQHDIYTLPQLVTVAEDSAKTNFAHLVDGDGMWREWDVFLQQLFRPVKGVRSFQHFLFNSETPGVVLVKATRDGKEKQLSLQRETAISTQAKRIFGASKKCSPPSHSFCWRHYSRAAEVSFYRYPPACACVFSG